MSAPWIKFAIITILALASADVCVKIAAGKVSNSLAMLIYGSTAFLVSLAWFLQQYFTGIKPEYTSTGVIAAFGVALSFVSVTLGLYYCFAAGAPISLASPTIRLGGLCLASLVGIFFFKEVINFRYCLGMSLAISGVYLMMTR